MDTPAPPRIVSLLPAATEIVAALGLQPALVGRSHECDTPADILAVPPLTAPRVDPAASSRAIHEAVGRAVATDTGSTAMFTLDIDRLAALGPDVILTQATCDVCAISGNDVTEAVRRSRHAAQVVPLTATTLRGLWDDILAVGRATGRLARARELVARLQARCDSIACRVAALGRRAGHVRPRVAVIEWLDPPMAAGNWVPELVGLAGGDDVLGRPGEHSHWIDWDAVAAADPDVVLLSPCGFTLDRIVAECGSPAIQPHLQHLRAGAAGRLYAIDGHHLLNRPGPRLVDSLEVLAALLHPGAFSFPAAAAYAAPVT
jgi:iron complex transport system substrate-binding protein